MRTEPSVKHEQPAGADVDKNVDPAAYDNFQAGAAAAPTAEYTTDRKSSYERTSSAAPPIATLRSPSPTPARSTVSTPPVASPPPQQHQNQQQHHQPQHQPPPQQQHQYAAYEYPPHTYMYAPPPPHPHQYPPPPHPDQHRYGHYAPPPPHPQPYPVVQHGGYVPYPLPGTVLSAPAPPPAGPPPGVDVVHTDDAATKLSDRVRRRCFNCCTTETSTWRRSNLSPGKVLCNKCGLFERTHSRPRPEQFPHKRGPLAASSLRSRSPAQGSSQPSNPHPQAQPSHPHAYQPSHPHAYQPYPPPAPPGAAHLGPNASYSAHLGPTASGSGSGSAPPSHDGQQQNGQQNGHQQQQNGGSPAPGSKPASSSAANGVNGNGAETQRLPGVEALRSGGKPASRGEEAERGEERE